MTEIVKVFKNRLEYVLDGFKKEQCSRCPQYLREYCKNRPVGEMCVETCIAYIKGEVGWQKR